MLEVFIVIICVYIFFRLLGRFLFPWLIKKYMKKFEKNFYKQNSHINQQKNTKEGKISIDYSESNENKDKYDDIGEYVDFEEKKD